MCLTALAALFGHVYILCFYFVCYVSHSLSGSIRSRHKTMPLLMTATSLTALAALFGHVKKRRHENVLK